MRAGKRSPRAGGEGGAVLRSPAWAPCAGLQQPASHEKPGSCSGRWRRWRPVAVLSVLAQRCPRSCRGPSSRSPNLSPLIPTTSQSPGRHVQRPPVRGSPAPWRARPAWRPGATGPGDPPTRGRPPPWRSAGAPQCISTGGRVPWGGWRPKGTKQLAAAGPCLHPLPPPHTHTHTQTSVGVRWGDTIGRGGSERNAAAMCADPRTWRVLHPCRTRHSPPRQPTRSRSPCARPPSRPCWTSSPS